MTFLQLAELFGAYCALAFIVAFAALVAYINTTGKVPPLLDGTRLGCALDDTDRAHLLDLALAEDREVAALDSLWELDSVEPRRWAS
jgi:hypothetical protein